MTSCSNCGAGIYVQRNQVPRREGKYCSVACKAAAQVGVETSLGTTYAREDGYIVVKTGVRQWELEHRLVMAGVLGRHLRPEEHVHHINGDKTDNRPDNLMVLDVVEHARLHAAEKREKERAVA